MHVTAMTPRYFNPNLKTKRIWVPELKKFVTVKVAARALKRFRRTAPTPLSRRQDSSNPTQPPTQRKDPRPWHSASSAKKAERPIFSTAASRNSAAVRK